MASVRLGPPMTACQSVTDNWLAMGVEVRSGPMLNDLAELAALGVGESHEHARLVDESVQKHGGELVTAVAERYQHNRWGIA